MAHVDIGLIVASTAVLAVGFADAIGLGSTEPQAESAGPGAIRLKIFNLAVPIGTQIPDGSGVRLVPSETEFAPAVGRNESASEPSAAGAPSATFDERFYFDHPTASFDERFASAFGSSGNAAGKVAEAEEQADDVLPQQVDFGEQATGKPEAAQPASIPVPASRHASIRQERINAVEASLSFPLDPDSRTAIYDIAARTVYLPNGHRLEAHSGLGGRLDDPRYVDAKMQGPTPPNVYHLTLRERLFHGVRAIRLVPVDDRKMFGRDGILAHSYMLGPSGQSNGCVSFRNYSAFLDAFLRGEVDRIVVVKHLATTTGAKAGAASGG